MAFEPEFSVTAKLLQTVESIAALRERIAAATLQVAWIPALQKDARVRNTHSSTAIEGNPLTLEQVRELEEGRALVAITERSQREVLNYFAALRYMEKNAHVKTLTHEHVLKLHSIIAGGVMDQGDAGRYRSIMVRVGRHVPPPPEQVSGLMRELIDWWNKDAPQWSPVLSSAIVHFQFEDIHPFADGNGRTGRLLALWELYRRGFDTHHIFSIDEIYWEDRPRYYASLQAVSADGGNLTSWLEYTAEGLRLTLEKVWLRIQRLTANAGAHKIVLRPKQEQLLQLLRERQSMAPREVWDAIGVSKQAATKLMKPLIDAGLVRRIGSQKSGRYILA
jgi:Fic family protein